jgi:hypothetical protein
MNWRIIYFEDGQVASQYFQALKARLQRAKSLLQEHNMEEEMMLEMLRKRVAKKSDLKRIDLLSEEDDQEEKKGEFVESLIREYLNKNEVATNENPSQRRISDSCEDVRAQKMCRKIIGISNDLVNRRVCGALE